MVNPKNNYILYNIMYNRNNIKIGDKFKTPKYYLEDHELNDCGPDPFITITDISKTHEIAHFELGYKEPFLKGKLHSGEYFDKLEKYDS